ncbi:hypothetical protein VTJ83DRAFT_2901 [Remersonia thermophila]|uniref:Uncharacterized protein n=1 Tax=Remersonia thermophila TaxID=72144 RepID=A0ABR4DCI9_9PEZI
MTRLGVGHWATKVTVKMGPAWLLLGCLATVGAQSTATLTFSSTSGQCNGVGFSSCHRLTQLLAECAKKHAKAEDNVACFCTQDMLDAMVYCKGEVRSCLSTYHADAPYDGMMSVWEERCQPHLTTLYPSSTLTTPTLASPTATADPDGCKAAWKACQSRDDHLRSCMRSLTTDVTHTITGPPAWTKTVTLVTAAPNHEEILSGCLCQEHHLALASACYVDRSHCHPGFTHALSGAIESRFCGTGWATRASITATSTAPSPTQTQTATNGESDGATEPIPVSTATQSAAGNGGPRPWQGGAVFLFPAAALGF